MKLWQGINIYDGKVTNAGVAEATGSPIIRLRKC